MEFVEIVGSPMFLHIKVKDRAKRGNGMKISTKFVFNGVEYILKSFDFGNFYLTFMIHNVYLDRLLYPE